MINSAVRNTDIVIVCRTGGLVFAPLDLVGVDHV